MPTPDYQAQLNAKLDRLRGLFAAVSNDAVEVHPSPPDHFRQRAEFRIWHESDDCYFVMFKPGRPPRPYRVDSLPAASERINAMMTMLHDAVLATPALRERLYQVEFLDTLNGDALLTLVYHRVLDSAWTAAASVLERELDCAVIGRSRRQRLVLSRDHVTEVVELDGHRWQYRQPEGGFSQPNAVVNQAMLRWARDCCRTDADGDLLELYCGNGNFTVALADCFRQVLATEVAKVSVHAALHNLTANGIGNVRLARLSSAEMSQALSRERAFRRLREIDLDSMQFNCLFVDPPRAGLDEATLELARGFSSIVYISCNPETLHANVLALHDSHRIERLALFDQFPFTPHIESGVLLRRHQTS